MLVVEDGTGLPNANSYADIAYADAYCSLRGLSGWATLSDEEKEQQLQLGTQYAELRWGNHLSGRPLKLDQALEWPRVGVKDRYGRIINGVPEDWKKAVCEYAYLSSQKALIPDSATVNTSTGITKKLTKVGPITTETQYSDSVSNRTYYYTHPVPDMQVRPFLNGSFGQSKVIRA